MFNGISPQSNHIKKSRATPLDGRPGLWTCNIDSTPPLVRSVAFYKWKS